MLEIWIVVTLVMPDYGSRVMLNEKRPSIEACLTEAREILTADSGQDEPYELAVQCSTLLRQKRDPA